MVFSLVNQFLSRAPVDFPGPDWDARRAQNLGIKPPAQEVQNPAAVAVASAHWLTAVCWVEGVEPESLALAPMLLSQVQMELETLRKLDPLEVYVAALESLTLVEEEEEAEYEEEPSDASVT